MESGKQFGFHDDIVSTANKREKKQNLKEENKETKDSINITTQLKRGRDKKSNWIEHLGYKFNAQDKGGFSY